MRVCLRCGTCIDGHRPQALYCRGACRAAASRARAEERASALAALRWTTKPHRNRTEAGRGDDGYKLATPAEEARIDCILGRREGEAA